MANVGEFINTLHELASMKQKGLVDPEFEEEWVQDVKKMEDAVVNMHEIYLPSIEPSIDWKWERRYHKIYKHLE